ncbi:helix-turn-helix domain-containing protein [Mucilaginibacter gilvus]|uniref:AraC family transcriptional regulator n=1 Tax=Mucilaginibacter gilvus TaxID=2305909 RepID=A0A3S4Y979_9SPHI|nr:AraC family transcriptional regulator [Mucilaginibacter gilvus]RWY50172.1 AraC family transcriptional regulator [Mucilaginibacter gilvus]
MPQSASTVFPKIYLYRRVVQAKLFIDTHYHQPINLDAIADEAYFSKFHFIRLFKATYGKTPHQYLTAVRINNAQLLLKTGMPVTDVCYAIGFDSVSSFSALFKRITKKSPSSWQQAELKRAAVMKKSPLNFIPNCFAQQNGWTQNRNFQQQEEPVVADL